jgi:hypothetical protein
MKIQLKMRIRKNENEMKFRLVEFHKAFIINK